MSEEVRKYAHCKQTEYAYVIHFAFFLQTYLFLYLFTYNSNNHSSAKR